jgi:hypothetical protein
MQEESDHTGLRPGKAALMAGVEVRDHDIEPHPGLHIATIVLRIASIVILLLALGQFAAWWADRPAGGVGVGVLVGDTIRLIVFAGLLWAASELADILVRTHYDVRAARILLARQTHMIRHIGIVRGELPAVIEPEGHRREDDDVGTSRP